jgi:hypothetical protein
MRGRTKRLAIVVPLEIADVATGNYDCGMIWEAYARDLFAKAALLGLLYVWVASAVLKWLHVAYDLRRTLRERVDRLAFNAVPASGELGRDSNV